MKVRLMRTVEKALYAIEVVVFLGLLIACVGGIYTYGMMHGELIGEGKGYAECKVETLFPTQSELDKVKNYFRIE